MDPTIKVAIIGAAGSLAVAALALISSIRSARFAAKAQQRIAELESSYNRRLEALRRSDEEMSRCKHSANLLWSNAQKLIGCAELMAMGHESRLDARDAIKSAVKDLETGYAEVGFNLPEDLRLVWRKAIDEAGFIIAVFTLTDIITAV